MMACNEFSAVIIADNFYTVTTAGAGTIDPFGLETREVLPASATSWVLGHTPAEANEMRLYVNGHKQIFGVDFTVSVATVLWTGYTLQSGWYVEVYYR